MPKRAKFKLHKVYVQKYGNFGYALVVPPSGMTPRQIEESDSGQYEINVDEPSDMSRANFNSTMGYVRRALAAYRKQGGR